MSTLVGVKKDQSFNLMQDRQRNDIFPPPYLMQPLVYCNFDSAQNDNDTKELYYSVHCQNCNTQVAALDRVEEIYHFFACLASN